MPVIEDLAVLYSYSQKLPLSTRKIYPFQYWQPTAHINLRIRFLYEHTTTLQDPYKR